MTKKIRIADLPDFDPAEHLKDEDDIAAYLTVILEENDPALLAAALGDIARARGMSDIAPDSGRRAPSIPFWRDSRVLGVLAQIAFFALVVAGLVGLGRNVAGNMGRLGENQFLCRDGSSSIRCAFDFLRLDAQFDIAETVIPFDPSDSYGRALLVGALNTIKVGVFGIVLATICLLYTSDAADE